MMEITYLPASGSTEDTFVARGIHKLFMAAEVDRTEVRLGWAEEAVVDSAHGMRWEMVGQLVLPEVRLAPDAAQLGVGAVGIHDTAWARMGTAIRGLIPGERVPGATYGTFSELLEGKRGGAAADVLEALTLRASDTFQVQPDQLQPPHGSDTAAEAAAKVAYNKAVRAGEFLQELTLGQMVGADGRLGRLATIYAWMGSHITRESRDAPAFRRNVTVLRAAVAAREGVRAEELESDELAAGVAALMAVTAVKPYLRRLHPEPGGVATRQEMRSWTQAWAVGEAGSERQLAGILQANFAAVVRCVPLLSAMVGHGSAAGTSGLPVDAGLAHAAVSSVAWRASVITSQAEALGPAALDELIARAGHLSDLLSAEPWESKTMQERMDHVVLALRTGGVGAASGGAGAMPPMLHSGGGAAAGRDRQAGSGAVPKHYMDRVGPATSSSDYRRLRAAIMARWAEGGDDADIDVLQMAVTGIIGKDEDGATVRVWVPLIHMMAEPKKVLQADLIDPDLARLTDLARTAWPEMMGRAVGLRLSIKPGVLQEKLVGFALHDAAAAIDGDDYGGLDLGACYRSARAALRERTAVDAASGAPYTTKEDVEDALEAACVLMPLRGFHGAGKGTLPYVLQQVAQTWRLYGGSGSTETIREKIAGRGSEYVLATLKRFGMVRDAMATTRDPAARKHEDVAPTQAQKAFDRHVELLEGALAVQGYVEYGRPEGAGNSRKERTPKGKEPKGGEQKGKGKGKPQPEFSIKIGINEGKVAVTQGGQPRGTYAISKLNDHALLGAGACLRGLVTEHISTSEAAKAAISCRKHERGAEAHAFKEGATLSMCKLEGAPPKGGTPAPKAGAQKQKTRPEPAPEEAGDSPEDDGGDGDSLGEADEDASESGRSASSRVSAGSAMSRASGHARKGPHAPKGGAAKRPRQGFQRQ